MCGFLFFVVRLLGCIVRNMNITSFFLRKSKLFCTFASGITILKNEGRFGFGRWRHARVIYRRCAGYDDGAALHALGMQDAQKQWQALERYLKQHQQQ